MMKVTHLTSVHPTFDQRIFHKECRSLAAAGYDVSLIVPHGQDDLVENVRIKSVPSPKNRWVRRSLTLWQVYRTALKENAYLYHLHDPELLPVGILLLLQGKKVIYDVHEDVPRQVLSNPSIPVWFRKPVSIIVEGLEWVVSKLFYGIVVATPAIGARFPEEKTVFVQNFPIRDELRLDSTLPYQERPANIGYVGVIAEIRGAKEMIKAMTLLPESLGARLVMAGKFSPPQLEKEMQECREWDHIDYLGWLDRSQIAKLLEASRIGLVVLYPRVNYIDSYPVKLFEYMSAGIPVIASDFPLWRTLIDKNGCGIIVNPLDPSAIANAIEYLLKNPTEAEAMGKRGRNAVRQYYNWDIEKEKLFELYDRLVN